MSYPSLEQYNQVLQHPEFCLNDLDLTENKKYFEGINFVHDKALASHKYVKVDANKAWEKLSSQMGATSSRVSDAKTIGILIKLAGFV